MVVKCENQFGMEVVYVTKRKKAESVEQKLVTLLKKEKNYQLFLSECAKKVNKSPLEILSMIKQFTHIERSYVRINGEIKNVLRLVTELKEY
ncbi:hypothetical protein [Enterococcus faecalis]|uniref:hypothetical protein n=1 Tax=Enterococcus faecalis TaxID=1351 RepID=UPI001C10C82A|nr:hypothetical protein [Enterococcus faecalis]MBU5339953.1 hypothetical protein [Enterococcus faecalis]MCV6008451.1 hypothetical protein [Enterococcus faecalis]MDJ9036991.1 hypothetical protein [Enterococcus faecalis]MDJ9040023.1 hypothetical protein [Enterococcus faecalis]MDK4429750.1 hypothetical protein [Enterococcus faecalis]